MNAAGRTNLNGALKRLAAGDRSASTEVFELVWPILKRYCATWLGSSDSEDVAQTALLKLFAQVQQFDASRDGLSWALEIASWECRTVRKQRLRKQGEALMPDTSPAHQSLADEALEGQQLTAAVNEVASQLAPADQLELAKVLSEQLAGDAAGRKRRQRAITRFSRLWRILHADY